MIQFGFQRYLNILQVALEKAARSKQEVGQQVAVLDLEKAYDRVVRSLLIDELVKHDILENLMNQLVVFLFPLTVKTAVDLIETLSVLTTVLVREARPP